MRFPGFLMAPQLGRFSYQGAGLQLTLLILLSTTRRSANSRAVFLGNVIETVTPEGDGMAL